MSTAAAHHSAPPRMTVIVVTPDVFATVAQTFRHVAEQTNAGELEVLLVGPDESVGDAVLPSHIERFASFSVIAVGPIDDVDKAAADAIRAASAPLVALVEDHAFPEPTWAASLAAAHDRGDWAAVGSTVVNANATSPLSWSNQLMSYGEWTEPAVHGVSGNISRHNVSFKKRFLEPYLDDLDKHLGRGGGLLQKLLKDGAQFYVETDARVRHVNPSRLSSTVQLRFLGGRLAAASRVRQEKWGPGKRAVYFGGSPLIPAVRWFKTRRPLMHLPMRRKLDVWPSFLGALILDAAGQAVGFLAGPGDSEQRLAAFEFHRERHLRDAEQSLLLGAAPGAEADGASGGGASGGGADGGGADGS